MIIRFITIYVHYHWLALGVFQENARDDTSHWNGPRAPPICERQTKNDDTIVVSVTY